jgi:hypothetical protein
MDVAVVAGIELADRDIDSRKDPDLADWMGQAYDAAGDLVHSGVEKF